MAVSGRARWMGKEVLLDEKHFADAVSPGAAEVICIFLNQGLLSCRDTTVDQFALVREVLVHG